MASECIFSRWSIRQKDGLAGHFFLVHCGHHIHCASSGAFSGSQAIVALLSWETRSCTSLNGIFLSKALMRLRCGPAIRVPQASVFCRRWRSVYCCLCWPALGRFRQLTRIGIVDRSHDTWSFGFSDLRPVFACLPHPDLLSSAYHVLGREHGSRCDVPEGVFATRLRIESARGCSP